MNTDQIIENINRIIKPYVQNEEAFQSLNLQTDFVRDLEINSANLVDIVLDVEDEFDIAIDNEAMDQMTTVGEAIRIIEEKKRDEGK